MLNDRLNWNDLRFFLEASRKGTFLGAAKRLGVNHTTVGRRISALEDALEVRLFDRTENGLHLTQAGEELLPLVLQMENASDIAVERVEATGHSVSGSLRIGAPDGFGNAFLAGQIVNFIRDNPEFNVELVPVPLSHNLMKREVDLVVSLEPTNRPNISCQKIIDYQLFLYTSQKYLMDKGINELDLKNLSDHCFADYISEILYTEQLNFNKHINREIISQFQSSTVLAQYEFVASGGGIGVLPYFMAWKDVRLVPVLPEEISFTRSYWLLVPFELQRLASVRRMQNFILSTTNANDRIFKPEAVGFSKN